MGKNLKTKVMALLMAILCLVGTMPAVSVKAESDFTDDKENVRFTVELMYEFMNETVVASSDRYLPLFTAYSDEQTIEGVKEQCTKMLAILDTDEDYVEAYNAYREAIDKLLINWNIKLPSRQALKELIDDVESYHAYIDHSDTFDDVEPGKMWVKPEILTELDKALENAKNVYAATTDDVADDSEAYNNIYNACVELDEAYDNVIDNVQKKECKVSDVKNILDELKNITTKEKIKIYNTDEEAVADNAVYYVLKSTQDEAVKAISVIENKLVNLTDDDSELTYNYAKRALNRYINGIVSRPETDGTVTEEAFGSMIRIYEVVFDNNYLHVVLSADMVPYGEAYTDIDSMNEYEKEYNRVKALYDNRANVACDYNQLYIDMQNAIIKLRKNIKYKETTIKDLDNTIASAEALKNQFDGTYETKEQIEQYGKKGQQYILKADMAELNEAINDVKNDKNNLPADEIEREYNIMIDVMYLSSCMTDAMSKVIIVNVNNDDLNRIISLSEEFISEVYVAESADEVPEGRFWITKNAADQMKNYIDRAKAVLNTDSITDKDAAYNALNTVFEKAKNMVKKGTAVEVTPSEDVNTDNNNTSENTNASENVETPKTGDSSAIYVYAFAAALSAAVLALAAEKHRKVRK